MHQTPLNWSNSDLRALSFPERCAALIPDASLRFAGAAEISRAAWTHREEIAREFTQSRAHIPNVLIVVHVLHPLDQGVFPNTEYARRLEYAANLYRNEVAAGNAVQILTPGSRHADGGEDQISLAEAGRRYLRAAGINPQDLLADDINVKYKGPTAPLPGVFGTADECFVGSHLVFDKPFGRLLAVASPNQSMRLQLHYIWFGVMAEVFSVPVAGSTYARPVGESMDVIPRILKYDPSEQEPQSPEGLRKRGQRQPKNWSATENFADLKSFS